MYEFRVDKFLGDGSFSTVFGAISRRGEDVGQSYALKRFHGQDDESVKCALREHHILTRVAMETEHATFLPTLFYGFVLDKSPILVVSEGSGFDLSDVLVEYFPLNVEDAIFYCSEIICGLEYLHSLGIVHMDIKPENILLTKSGHVMIADFDSSYDMIYGNRPPQPEDFKGTIQYMAPEVENKCHISFKSDIWSLATTLARMLFGFIHPNSPLDQISDREWIDRGFKQFREPLQAFFAACLQLDPDERPSIMEIKRLKLFRNVNWNNSALLNQPPPYQVSRISRGMGTIRQNTHPRDQQILRKLWKGELDFTVDIRSHLHPHQNEAVDGEVDVLLSHFYFVNCKVSCI